MRKTPNPEMIDAENPEWTREDFANSVPFSQLPESLQTKLRSLKKPRGPQKAATAAESSHQGSCHHPSFPRCGGAASCHWPRMADASGHGIAAMD